MSPREVPSVHELRTVAEAFSAADPFSYSPVFFASRVEDILDSSASGSPHSFFMGRCQSGFSYFRSDWSDRPEHVAFTLFVSAFYKWILRISDMVPCEPQDSDGPMALSKRMFRDEEWNAEATVSVDASQLRRLADELMTLALISDIQDHCFYHAKQDFTRSDGLVLSGSENNLLFARDGRFAIFDLEPVWGPPTLATALRFSRWSDFSPASVPDVEMSFGSLRRYFRFEDSDLGEIFRELKRQYDGEDGARLFSAIVRRSGILGPDVSDESIRGYHSELLASLARHIDAMDSGEFYPWLRRLLCTEAHITSAA